MTPIAEHRKVWLNKPQKLSSLIQAKEEYGTWGRATGKTDGPLSERTAHQASVMPTGTTGMVAATYMQHLDRTLPPLFKSWENRGFKKDVHYWVRQRPPKTLKIPDPIFKVLDPQHYIFWYTGHVFYLISQDRQGLANAKSLDAVAGDEVKFLNFAQYLEEVVPANRGNDNIFGHLAEHHSVTMFTDMPTKQHAKWILEKADLVDMDRITQVINLQLKYNEMYAEFLHHRTTKPRKEYLNRKLINYWVALNELRMGQIMSNGKREPGLVWYSEASTLENIQILGEEKFTQWERELPQMVFDASILNLKNIAVPNGFFHMLDLEYHCYNSYDYNYIDSLGLYLPNGVVQDCRKDGDIIKNRPLDISLDYNAAIKSLVVGQDSSKFFKGLKSMFVLAADRKILTDVVKEFCDYYEPHPCKEVFYYYDNTAMVTDATRLETLADIVVGELVKNKWTVHRRYIGQQPEQDIRYRLWETVFQEKDHRFKPARFNRENCDQLLISMQQSGVKQFGNKFKKNKDTEKKGSKVRPQDAPHLSDAWETMYIGKFKEDYGYEIPITDIITS